MHQSCKQLRTTTVVVLLSALLFGCGKGEDQRAGKQPVPATKTDVVKIASVGNVQQTAPAAGESNTDGSEAESQTTTDKESMPAKVSAGSSSPDTTASPAAVETVTAIEVQEKTRLDKPGSNDSQPETLAKAPSPLTGQAPLSESLKDAVAPAIAATTGEITIQDKAAAAIDSSASAVETAATSAAQQLAVADVVQKPTAGTDGGEADKTTEKGDGAGSSQPASVASSASGGQEVATSDSTVLQGLPVKDAMITDNAAQTERPVDHQSADETAVPSTHLDQLYTLLSKRGWQVQREADGSVSWWPGASEDAVDPARQQMEIMSRHLEESGWRVKRQPDNSILLLLQDESTE